jgi:hypothetical protein
MWLNIPLSPLQGHAASPDARYGQNMAGFFAAVDHVAKAVPYPTKFAGQHSSLLSCACSAISSVIDAARCREAAPGDLAHEAGLPDAPVYCAIVRKNRAG